MSEYYDCQGNFLSCYTIGVERPRLKTKIFLTILVAVAIGYAGFALRSSQPHSVLTRSVSPLTPTAKESAYTPCPGITDKTIVVSIEKRHLWACEDNETAYDSPVVTGDMNNAETLTPTGSYKIYAKRTDQTLRGSDAKGTWDVHVNYWLPFLHNQYGTYGFHDATWRDNDEFGTIDPYGSDGSHGCVELPLATSKWLYDWSTVDTTVLVQK